MGLSLVVDNLKEQLLSSYHVESVPDKKPDQIADEAFENREIDDAAILFSERIKMDSSILYPYIKLAECFQIKNEPQKALATYKIAFKKFPEDDHVATRLARQLTRLDSMSSALKITQALIDKHPGKTEYYFQAAMILTLLNNSAEAKRLLNKLVLEGNKPTLHWRIAFMLGELFYLSGNYGLASEYFDQAIHQHGSLRDPYLNYYYAKCLGFKGQDAEAKKYFYDAMELGAIIDKDSIKKFELIEKQSTPYAEKY
jgi:tetratricopeptide (TPR) repeat protein